MTTSTHTQAELEQMRDSYANRGLGGLARRLSNATKNIRSNSTSSKQRSSSTSRTPSTTSTTAVSDFPNIPAAGKPKRFTSQISHKRILESTAPTKYFIESDYCTHDLLTCEIKLRETSTDNLTAALDTAASSSFISTYEARTKFHSSDIKTLPVAMEFGTGGGPMRISEYVVADLYIPCALDAKTYLAKATAVLFLREGRLPSGSDVLLGMDFLMAQRISLLLPSLCAVVGACGNAIVPLIAHKNNDFPVRENAPDLTSRGRKTTMSVKDLIAESRATFQGPPLAAIRPRHEFDETNFFMTTSPASTDKREGKVYDRDDAAPFSTGANDPPSLMSGIPLWTAANTVPVGGKVGNISAPISAPRDSSLMPNGHPNPLRSNPGPGLSQNPAVAFSSLPRPGPVTARRTPMPPPPEPPVSPMERVFSTDISTISAPVPRPRPFTISDTKALGEPRPAPALPSNNSDAGERKRSVLGKIFLTNKSRKTSSSSDTSSTTSHDSSGTVRPEKKAKSRSKLLETTIDPHASLDAAMATKVACEEDFGGKPF